MKKILLLFVVIFFVMACAPDKALSTAEKIANAHGFEHWENVTEVAFTFRVDVDTLQGQSRSWIWQPKTSEVTMSTGATNRSYNQANITSTNIPIDRAFINDKFWLLVPFQLVWDSTATISEVFKKEAPISKSMLQRLTLTYPSTGGYTPGDAYDIYFDDNYLIREWTFRKGNAKTPTLSTTFENYQDFNGIKIALYHKKNNGAWNLNFSDVVIK